MDLWYQLLAEWSRTGWLPEVFAHAFIVRGLIAAAILGPTLGGIGTLVLPKRLTFFTQTLGHASLTGVALGLLLGEPIGATYGGLFGFCIAVAIVMVFLSHRTRASSDTVVGVVLAQVLGLGIILLVLVTKRFDIHQIEGVLFGSLIALNDLDLALLMTAGAAGLLYTTFAFNRDLLLAFNPVLARARRIPALSARYGFAVILTVVVVASLKIVGALLVLVLIVVPAAAAQNIAGNLRTFFGFSVLFGGASAVGGLLLSLESPVPTGGAIVLAASIIFYLTLVMRSGRTLASRTRG